MATDLEKESGDSWRNYIINDGDEVKDNMKILYRDPSQNKLVPGTVVKPLEDLMKVHVKLNDNAEICLPFRNFCEWKVQFLYNACYESNY